MPYTKTGSKPQNAKILDGGASWKDRYKVADELADMILMCATFNQGNSEVCLILARPGISWQDFMDLLTPQNEKFPMGSIAFLVNNFGVISIFIKATTDGWVRGYTN